ncbi:SRPBCC family protein [Planctomicrobium sp. SH527]|uniref:SRPBCC family protein n=1 Tax=Planctomicrobium sp. SH527 TaxID=3448123 RepID=UPI003F5B2EDC
MTPIRIEVDPELDLVLERVIDVPPELVWEAWTKPEHLMQWFCPKPWSVVDCEIDLRPGGIFRTVMKSPEGHEIPNVGCYLEVIPLKRLIMTDALLPGFRPAEKAFFTGVVSIEPNGTGTKYTAMAIHRDVEGRKEHEAIGFHEGWGIALDQLVAYVKENLMAK